MNQVMLVGRLVNNPEVIEVDDEMKVTQITLSIQRSFKNENGMYEIDYIPCVLWNGIASSTTEYCHKGDLIVVKGRLEKVNNKEMIVIAEKVTFLASKGKE